MPLFGIIPNPVKAYRKYAFAKMNEQLQGMKNQEGPQYNSRSDRLATNCENQGGTVIWDTDDNYYDCDKSNKVGRGGKRKNKTKRSRKYNRKTKTKAYRRRR